MRRCRRSARSCATDDKPSSRQEAAIARTPKAPKDTEGTTETPKRKATPTPKPAPKAAAKPKVALEAPAKPAAKAKPAPKAAAKPAAEPKAAPKAAAKPKAAPKAAAKPKAAPKAAAKPKAAPKAAAKPKAAPKAAAKPKAAPKAAAKPEAAAKAAAQPAAKPKTTPESAPAPRPKRAAGAKREKVAPALLDRLVEAARRSLDEDKAENILVLDVTGRADYADRLVIATGLVDRQIQAMANHLEDCFEKEGLKLNRNAIQASPDWVLIDAGDLVVHLFKPEARQMYALERMWGPDSPAPNLPTDAEFLPDDGSVPEAGIEEDDE